MNQLRLKVKQWEKYPPESQEIILTKYDVILTDHRSGREKLKYALDTYPKKLDKGLKMLDKGFQAFDKGMAEFDKGLKSSLGENKKTLNITGNHKKPSIF